MTRTIVTQFNSNEVIGDETYEVWLKHESDPWALVDAGDVESPTQQFTLPGLIDGDHYAMQVRMTRAGRYRVGYLSADPETWPAGSRLEFTVGSLIDVGAPTLDAVDDWVRVDADHTKFTVHITPNDTTQDLQLLRDNVVVHTFAAPLASPIVYDDVDPPLNANHTWKARHIAGTLVGPTSGTITKYAGPPPVLGFNQTSVFDNYGNYTVGWTDDGRTVRIEDDYLCVATSFVGLTGSPYVGGGGGTHTEQKETTEIPEGAVQSIAFHARIRAEVTTFGVTDVSDWDEILIQMTIDDPDDDTNFNTCP